MNETLVTVATYNEKENIQTLIETIFEYAPNVDILVVDDASPDGTGQIVDQMAESDQRVHILHRPGKLGLGTATTDAMQYAMKNDYALILNMDADFSHHPKYLPEILKQMESRSEDSDDAKPVDIVIGSRYVKGGSIVGWNWKRHFMSWGINTYSRILLRMNIKDKSGAFRCYRTSMLRNVDFNRIVSKGYAFQEEFLFRCIQAGARVVEVPICFEDRVRGQSNLNVKEIIRALKDLIVVAIKR